MKYATKLFILLILSSLSIPKVIAQTYNSFGGPRIGFALPMGQFASHDFETGGYALLGKSAGVEAAWFITPTLGLGIDVSIKSFGFASGYFADDYADNDPSTKTVDLLSGPYNVRTYMAGGYYKMHLAKKFYSTFKLMGGIYTAITPDQFYGVVDNLFQKENFFWKTGSLERTFGFLTGASFEYNIFEHVSLLLQADFSYAKPAFSYYKGTEQYTVEMQMPIFQLLPGINIYF